MGFSAKITSKGQVTIPKEIRNKLRANVVEFFWTTQGSVIRPVQNFGGALSNYGKKFIPIKNVRKKFWAEIAREKNKILILDFRQKKKKSYEIEGVLYFSWLRGNIGCFLRDIIK